MARYVEVDRTDELVQLFRDASIDALITIGGDGSLTIGERLHHAGLRVIGVPKTIDNDLDKTHQTFGFDTAVGFASECIDRLFSTATSHGRVIVVEVMGRYAGWIALESGVASSAHAILIPEIPYELEPVAATIAQREARGAKFSIVVVAEGAAPVGGEVSVIRHTVGQAEKLGGIGWQVAAQLEELTGKESRTVVLGPPAPRRLADRVRPPARAALRRGRGARPGGGSGRRDGGAQPAAGRLRAAERGDQPDEVGAARLRHDAHGPRHRHQLRRPHAVAARVLLARYARVRLLAGARDAGPGCIGAAVGDRSGRDPGTSDAVRTLG